MLTHISVRGAREHNLKGIDVAMVLELVDIMIESKRLVEVDRGTSTAFDTFTSTLQVNNGVVTINDDTALSRTGGVFTNNSQVTIAAGTTLSFANSGNSVFTQAAIFWTAVLIVLGAGGQPQAVFALGVGPLEGLLVGAIVGSTDAAAVFLLLHQRGVELRRRLAATLEVESGIQWPEILAFLQTAQRDVAKPWQAELGDRLSHR